MLMNILKKLLPAAVCFFINIFFITTAITFLTLAAIAEGGFQIGTEKNKPLLGFGLSMLLLLATGQKILYASAAISPFVATLCAIDAYRHGFASGLDSFPKLLKELSHPEHSYWENFKTYFRENLSSTEPINHRQANQPNSSAHIMQQVGATTLPALDEKTETMYQRLDENNNFSEQNSEFFCPIQQTLMRNPVDLIYTNKNGIPIKRTYEHEAIARWLNTKNTDPLGGHDVLTSFKLVPNLSLREKILQAVIGFIAMLSMNKNTMVEKNNCSVASLQMTNSSEQLCKM